MKDLTYIVIKDGVGLPLGSTVSYDDYLKTCIHVNKEKRLTSIPLKFVLNNPEYFQEVKC